MIQARKIHWLVAVAAAIGLLSPRPSCAVGGALASPDFTRDILPTLTRAGCNVGACHGAATGQGGFHLSLLGYDAGGDWEAIARELGGRRVDIASPGQSLLLRKATMAAPHGGGKRLAVGDPSFARLAAWIRAGAPRGDTRERLIKLTVQPGEILDAQPGRSVALKVTADAGDGTSYDVTHLATYRADSPEISSVSSEGVVQVNSRGLGAVTVRYLGAVTALQAGAAYAPAAAAPAVGAPGLDGPLFARIARLGLKPSPPAEPAELVRRLYLDLIGQLPPSELAREVSSSTNGLATREDLVERLLSQPEFAEHWARKLGDLFQVSSKRIGAEPAVAYDRWLREAVRQDRPLDELVRGILTATGSVAEAPGGGFFRLATDPREVAENAARMFMGVRIQCARCHNHPFDRWTQADYHAFAAVFARTTASGDRVVQKERGEVPHPKTGKDVVPGTLGAGPLPSAADRREPLARWLTSPENPLFATAFANRIWKELMGRGIIEPVDDLRVSNPPSNPELLSEVVAEFTRGGYRLKPLIRSIVRSRGYRLASRSLPENARDERLFSRAYARPLHGVVLLDALASATGTSDFTDAAGVPLRAASLEDALTPSYTLDVLGRCRRDGPCEPELLGGGLAAALHLVNGEAIQKKLSEAATRLESLSVDTLVESLYLRSVSRLPRAEEAAHWRAYFSREGVRREQIEDLLWALLNSSEFAFNH